MPAENITEASTNPAAPFQRTFATIQEDILVEIFYLLSRDVDAKWKSGLAWDWVLTSEVCRNWNAVAAGTPKLWSFINKFRNTARLQKLLRLSKDADLYIIYDKSSYMSHYQDDCSNVKIALKEMRRIAHLTLTGHIAEGRVFQLLPYLELPAPRMRSITLGSFFNNLPRLPALSTSSDVLKCVSLQHITKAPSLACLSRLTLNGCQFSMSDFMSILEACPELEYLYLLQCKFGRSNTSTIKSIHLPRLEQLYLKEVTDTFDIIQNIEAPNVLRWYLACARDDFTKLDVLAKLMLREYHAEEISIRVRYYSNIYNSSSIDVVVRPDKAHFNPGHASLQLRFNRDVESIGDMNAALQHRIQIFAQRMSKIPVLHISDEDDAITTNTWNSVFLQCVSATTLKIHIGTRDDGGIPCLDALAQVYYSSSEKPIAKLPNLEHLVIYNVWSGNPTRFLLSLENMLEKRSVNGFPIRKITIYSGHISPLNTGMLRQWVKELEFIRELLHLDLVKDLW